MEELCKTQTSPNEIAFRDYKLRKYDMRKETMAECPLRTRAHLLADQSVNHLVFTYGHLQEVLDDLGFAQVEAANARVYHKADADVWIALPPVSSQTPVDAAHLLGVRMILTAGNVTSLDAFAALVAQKSQIPRQSNRTPAPNRIEAA